MLAGTFTVNHDLRSNIRTAIKGRWFFHAENDGLIGVEELYCVKRATLWVEHKKYGAHCLFDAYIAPLALLLYRANGTG